MPFLLTGFNLRSAILEVCHVYYLDMALSLSIYLSAQILALVLSITQRRYLTALNSTLCSVNGGHAVSIFIELCVFPINTKDRMEPLA